MAKRIRELDWATTPLGPSERWPNALCVIVDLILPAGFPMIVLGGAGTMAATELEAKGHSEQFALSGPELTVSPKRQKC
jgi:hypothetical protein